MFVSRQIPDARSGHPSRTLELDSSRRLRPRLGVGSCALGYADPDVDNAAIAAIQCGSMCTLNAPEEVQLADLLCELHPWAQMARFARTGGDNAPMRRSSLRLSIALI